MRSRNILERTISLSGEDSLNFARTIFIPTIDEMKINNEIVEQMNDNVKIDRESDNHYTAEISDLDLSFLDSDDDEIFESVSVKISISIQLKENDEVFSFEDEEMCNEVVIKEEESHYSYSDNNFFHFAA